MNWLALKSLKEKYMVSGPNRERATKVYAELRSNLIGNVFKVSRKAWSTAHLA